MILKRQCVSSSVVSIPSIELASILGIFLFLSSSSGFVSSSEHRKSVSEFGDVSKFVCSLYMSWNVVCSSVLICLVSVISKNGLLVASSFLSELKWGVLMRRGVISEYPALLLSRLRKVLVGCSC